MAKKKAKKKTGDVLSMGPQKPVGWEIDEAKYNAARKPKPRGKSSNRL